MTLSLATAWAVASLFREEPWLAWTWIPMLIAGLAACVSEVSFRRDRLLFHGIERRSGLFGTRVRVIPYRSVELVSVEDDGSSVDTGTVVVRADGTTHRLVAVASPHEVAAIIERLR